MPLHRPGRGGYRIAVPKGKLHDSILRVDVRRRHDSRHFHQRRAVGNAGAGFARTGVYVSGPDKHGSDFGQPLLQILAGSRVSAAQSLALDSAWLRKRIACDGSVLAPGASAFSFWPIALG